MPNTLQIRRGTKANLPTLAAGEPGFCTDTYELYIGDGATNRPIGIGTGTKPAASAAVRGIIWYVAGAAGVKDTLEVCIKTATDAYEWAIIY